jgi:hypothetical protein
MISLRKTLAASSLALGIAATAAPVGAQYYYPSQNYWPDNQGYSYYSSRQTYNTPGGGWGERGSNGWSYHGGGFDLGRDSNGCIYASEWSNC